VLLDGALDRVAPNGKAGAYQWPGLLSFDDSARREERHAMRRFELFDREQLGQQAAIGQIAPIGDVDASL
jgi:hypothetical protein